MSAKYFRLAVPFALFLLVAACGPSPEQIATMTASAWTPTPQPSSTPTPIPYDLTVSIVDEASIPIAGASIIFPESGNAEPIIVDTTGKFTWMNLPDASATLKVSAQGYLPVEQSITLERGLSELSITLRRDPFGLLPSTACAAGETLLYLEDFQDGETTLVSHQMPVPPLEAAPNEEGNIVLVHDFTNPVEDFSTYLSPLNGVSFAFGDAAWRMRFMITQETNWGVDWNNAGPNEFGGITTSQSGYGISFNTGRHIVIRRSIWDTSGERVWDIGKPDLADQVLILEPNIWHYLEISTFQGQFQVWLDGEMVVDVVDDMPLPPGAFQIGKGDTGIQYFDAITVCKLNTSFTSIPAPVPFSTTTP